MAGAPRGNENAKKEAGRGRTMGLYITVEEEQILRELLRGSGKDIPIKKEVDAYARNLFKMAVQDAKLKNKFFNNLKTDRKNA